MLLLTALALIIPLVSTTTKAVAEERRTPTTVEAPPPAQPFSLKKTSSTDRSHPFWDRTNVLLFSGIAISRTLDYASTRNMLARGREEILIPDDVVYSKAGFPALEAAGALTSIGISYLLHRKGHHQVERWLSIGHIGVTDFGAARNYSLESRHR